MTALQLADIPPDIDTVEKLHAWTGQVLGYLYRDESELEAVNRQRRVADSAQFENLAATPIDWRII
ncbi:MAG: hypothetical protein ACFB4J_13685, partial [Elainellaceae cyanobacterium]